MYFEERWNKIQERVDNSEVHRAVETMLLDNGIEQIVILI